MYGTRGLDGGSCRAAGSPVKLLGLVTHPELLPRLPCKMLGCLSLTSVCCSAGLQAHL